MNETSFFECNRGRDLGTPQETVVLRAEVNKELFTRYKQFVETCEGFKMAAQFEKFMEWVLKKENQ
jgi:hypothetical protein